MKAKGSCPTNYEQLYGPQPGRGQRSGLMDDLWSRYTVLHACFDAFPTATQQYYSASRQVRQYVFPLYMYMKNYYFFLLWAIIFKPVKDLMAECCSDYSCLQN